ncbi:DUF475 domain-containing protein [Sandarakinorhabdus sp.]|uniref:DUF475 domain-containing protein n=1 Tax=Sandarakinorhabdus sp. TaxID=1916663 RepID=UPI003F72414C
MLKHFTGSFVFTGVALALGTAYGYSSGGSIAAALSVLWICIVLGVLEVSLSFDNAVVNATTLKDMDAVWQRRFLTWGILIAVFGMRVVFPILIVAVAGKLGPIEAVNLSFTQPDEYARIVSAAHHTIMGFGGAFLFLVGLKFFIDAEKEHHWFPAIEERLTKFANLEALEIFFVLLLAYGISTALPIEEGHGFFVAAVFGVFTYFAVDWVGNAIGASEDDANTAKRTGLGAFLYLEVLDASFSFDGVIGAFALSNNLIIIALGLGIGAMFVRSMTVFLVRQGTLAQFRYLEHGAFWAILALAGIMFASTLVHIPEAITGLIGASLIGLALWSSIRYNKANPETGEDAAVASTPDAPLV